jgi:hypothetical protein
MSRSTSIFIGAATLALELAALVSLNCGLRSLLFRLTRFSAADYQRPVMSSALLRPATLAGVGTLTAPLLFTPWTDFGSASWPRGLVAFIVAVACICWSTYAFNWYLRYRHGVDRLLLVGLGAATVAHPAFAPAFVAVALVIARQFIYPLFPADKRIINYCHKLVILDCMLAFVAFASLSSVWPLPAERFLQLLLIIHGASYAWSGAAKLLMGWWPANDLRGVVAAGMAHGWFARSDHAPQRMARWLRATNPLLLALCLVIELGAAVLLLDARLAFVVLVSLAVMHVVILMMSGINFLPWSVLNLALAGIVTLQPASAFGTVPALCALLLLVAGRRLLRPVVLAWLDTRLCNAFHFVGVLANGKTVELGPEAFAPYDMIIANGKFLHISEDRLLVDAWGETKRREVMEQLEQVSTMEEVTRLEEHLGERHFRPGGVTAMREFLGAYLGAEHHRARAFPFSYLARDWLSNRHDRRSSTHQPLVAVEVRLSKVLVVGDQLRVVDNRLTMRVEKTSEVDPTCRTLA